MPEDNSQKSSNSLLNVEVLDPGHILFKGSAQAISSTNPQGNFDILPNHSHFISLIKKQVVILLQNGKTKKFEIDQGVIRCFDNNVEIYVGL